MTIEGQYSLFSGNEQGIYRVYTNDYFKDVFTADCGTIGYERIICKDGSQELTIYGKD